MDEYYFDGDPEVDSTRRHLERVLQGKQTRRWPWVVAAVAGGAAAFAFWRLRSRPPKSTEAATNATPTPTRAVEQTRR